MNNDTGFLPSPPDNTIIIQLTKGYATIVDYADLDLLRWKWKASGKYVRAARNVSIKGKWHTILMHRAIVERMIGRTLDGSEHVDHIDGNPLNNSRSNLRIVTNTQNAWNQHASKSNTSGYKGVCWHKRQQKWVAQICVNRRVIHLGTFETPEQGHKAYCEAAKQYFGEYARYS